MVHTALITYFPDAELIQRFISLKGTVSHKQEHVWVNNSLINSGLKFRLQTMYRNEFISPRLSCIINFSKVISTEKTVDVVGYWDIDQVEQRFNEMANAIGLPLFEYWKVNRIDYSINVKTPYVEEYISLMKKGDKPKLRDWYDRSSRNYGQKPGSLYLVSTAKSRRNRSCTVNFYNKQDERMHSISFPEDEEEVQQFERIMELSADILRLEIQCHKPKTEYIRKKYGFADKSIKNYLDPFICDDVIGTYLKRIAGTADYHRKQVAIDRIERSKCTPKNKARLIQIIKDIAVQHSSIDKVRIKYASEGVMTVEEYNSLIRTLYSMNINPVTITSNQKIEGKKLKEGLTSIYTLYKSALEDETTTTID